ncbi:MAG: hypothetical protein COV44_09020 [Deltaproteobacteria bacterium CG11_big_fil_rev_8_21_14_0_20_45_16]|nr:MAG: hypothetical protein COV44_09020 [Deltaproteobacteria bacterium CG11_big_fil_rev_8_21_14_0_20_45_16]
MSSSEILEPFSSDFDPLSYSLSKSHFQTAFCFLRSPLKRQALGDFYAYCRLVDDLCDETSLPLEPRRRALKQIHTWLADANSQNHPFWNRLNQHILHLQLDPSLFVNILKGVESDIQSDSNQLVSFETWQNVYDYIQGVACDVGEVCLQILGAKHSKQHEYAQNLGRCVQLLNIMRDLESDIEQNRVYLPQELLKSFGPEFVPLPNREVYPAIRDILYELAISFRQKARAYSWSCYIAELMVNLYIEAASRYWRHGVNRRLNKFQKLLISLKLSLQFVFSARNFSS